MTAMLKAINVSGSFLLELSMLASFGYWGFHGDRSLGLKWLLGIGLPLAVAMVWGLWLAPKAAQRLDLGAGVALSLLLFLLAAAALYAAKQPGLALALAALAVINRLLLLGWQQW